MTKSETKCCICGHPAQMWWWQDHAGQEVRCDYCGYYRIGDLTLRSFREQTIDPLRPYLPAHIRQALTPPELVDTWRQLAQPIAARTLEERARKVLTLLKERSDFQGRSVRFEPFDKPSCDLAHDEEAAYVIRFLIQRGLLEPSVNGLIVTPTGWQDGVEASRPTRVFLSHAVSDALLAQLLATEIRSRLPESAVFVSSQPGHIGTGEKWLEAIEQKLQGDDTFVILLTRASLERRWIWFEVGSFWFSGKRILPVVAGGLDRSEIPHPLSVRQALDLSDAAQVAQFFRDLSVDISHDEATTFVASLRGAEDAGRQWTSVNFEGQSYVWDGPLDSLADWSPVPASKPLVAFIESHGFRSRCARLDMMARHVEKGYRRVYVSDLKTYKRPLHCSDYPGHHWIIKGALPSETDHRKYA